jgi:hypothetical protein
MSKRSSNKGEQRHALAQAICTFFKQDRIADYGTEVGTQGDGLERKTAVVAQFHRVRSVTRSAGRKEAGTDQVGEFGAELQSVDEEIYSLGELRIFADRSRK